ncbi:hypothetical protein [Streptomyces sp. NPDC057582]|uniref:hypothetical protein n=1 Tax=unclassified Streptomyces TaxID=2593676 RepID=UPI0036BB31A9
MEEVRFVDLRRDEPGAVPLEVALREVDRVGIVRVELVALADPRPKLIVVGSRERKAIDSAFGAAGADDDGAVPVAA